LKNCPIDGAARGVAAVKRCEVDRASVAHFDRFRADLGGQQENDECGGCPDHRTLVAAKAQTPRQDRRSGAG
jgi:hypothetical protein